MFTFLSRNNYRFSNLFLLFVQIKYLIVCAIQLSSSLITSLDLDLLDMILSDKNMKCSTKGTAQVYFLRLVVIVWFF